ncbi:MAG: hypothetical protein Q9227_005224 [Pyrenula ochraceoflavens]
MDLPVFQHMVQDPVSSRRVASYMKKQTATGSRINHQYLIDGFDCSFLNSSPKAVTVVDVGSSMEHASVALAHGFPRLRFVVQVLETTIQVARQCTALPRPPGRCRQP